MMKRNKESMWLDIINYILIGIITFVVVYPFYYILINSLNEGIDASRGGIYLWPRKFSLDNYILFFNDIKWTKALIVTVFRTITGTIISVLFTCMVAYGLSFKQLIFKKFYMILIIISMYFSGGLIPYYILLKNLGLLNTFWVYIIPPALNIFFVLVAKAYFEDLPEEVIESARLDGANELLIFTKIIIPISKPLIATMILFLGVAHWNSWFDSAYFVKSDELRTLGYRMMEVINQSLAPTDVQSAIFSGEIRKATPLSLQMASMMIATIPIMCIYPFLQKYFVKGIMLGALKG